MLANLTEIARPISKQLLGVSLGCRWFHYTSNSPSLRRFGREIDHLRFQIKALRLANHCLLFCYRPKAYIPSNCVALADDINKIANQLKIINYFYTINNAPVYKIYTSVAASAKIYSAIYKLTFTELPILKRFRQMGFIMSKSLLLVENLTNRSLPKLRLTVLTIQYILVSIIRYQKETSRLESIQHDG